MEPGYFCRQILKNPCSLKCCVSLGLLLSEMAALPPEKDFTFAKVPNKRLHDVISCASRPGFNDPLNLSALKVEVCFLEL